MRLVINFLSNNVWDVFLVLKQCNRCYLLTLIQGNNKNVILMVIFSLFMVKMDTLNLFYFDEREKTSLGS